MIIVCDFSNTYKDTVLADKLHKQVEKLRTTLHLLKPGRL